MASSKRTSGWLTSGLTGLFLMAGVAGLAGLGKWGESIPLPERQSRVMAVMGDASKTAEIPPQLMVAIWSKESSFGKNLKSKTGSLGDFQFTRTTMTETLSHHGGVIARRLNKQAEKLEKSVDPKKRVRVQDIRDQARMVRQVHKATEGMNGKQIRNYAAANSKKIDYLRK